MKSQTPALSPFDAALPQALTSLGHPYTLTFNPPPFVFINLQIPPFQQSIRIPILFCILQIPFPATPVFSHRSESPGCRGAVVQNAFSFVESPIPRHAFSSPCAILRCSLQRRKNYPLSFQLHRDSLAKIPGWGTRARSIPGRSDASTFRRATFRRATFRRFDVQTFRRFDVQTCDVLNMRQ